MHLIEQINGWGHLCPDQPAHISDHRVLTYGELLVRSNALAAWLDAELGDSRAPVAVHGHKEPEMLVAFLGAVKSGRPYVPIDISIPAQRVERIVAAAGAALTLSPARIASLPAIQSPNRPIAQSSLLHPLHQRQHRRTEGRGHHAREPRTLRRVDAR